MLVLSRQRDETIMIGDEDTAFVRITKADLEFLKLLEVCKNPGELAALMLLGAKGGGTVFAAIKQLVSRLILSPHGPAEVTVVDIRGDKARFGVTVDGQVPVHRKEVYEAIQRGEGHNGNKKPSGPSTTSLLGRPPNSAPTAPVIPPPNVGVTGSATSTSIYPRS